MKAQEAKVSKRSSSKSNKGRETLVGRRTDAVRRLGSSRAALVAEVPEPFCAVNWNFAACLREAAAHRAEPDPRDRPSTADEFSHSVKYLGPSPSSFRRGKYAGD